MKKKKKGKKPQKIRRALKETKVGQHLPVTVR